MRPHAVFLMLQMLQTRKLLMLAAALTVTQVAAQDKPAAAAKPAAEPSLKERFENLGLIYKDKKNPGLQELWVLGRYHGHYHDNDGSHGQDSGFESRRVRLGFQATMFDRLTVHAQAISGSDFEPAYNGFTELWLRWQFAESLNLTVGQQKHRFTHDRNVSSRYMSFMERSMFTNMMGLDYTPAVTLSGRVDKLEYYAGLFSNSAGTDMWESFTQLDSGSSFLAAVTYDLGHFLGAETASFYGGYLNSEAHANATNLTRFDDALAGALIFTDGPAAFVAELTAGFGGARGDAIGLNLQPSYFLTDTLEVVGRYQIASSSQATGLSSQRRYERLAGMGNGDSYQAVYLGLNHYIAGHRLKLLTGMEYARMNQRDSFMVWAGIRMFFGPHSNAPYPGNKLLKGIW
jgi:phosphate-selective porin OprO/OprP